MDPTSQAVSESRWRLAWLLVLVTGTLMQIWLWQRSVWIYLDQVKLYELGMAWARDGELLPVGKISTGGLPIPGVFLQLIVGGPLDIWLDVRSPTLLLISFHLAAILIVSRVLAVDFGWRLTTLYLAIFWLSPWRLFHSGFLWETNYLLLPAALHLAVCRASRQAAKFGASALLGATLALTVQLHGSALILVLSSGILLMRKQLCVHWKGLAAGAMAGSITLIPTILASFRGALSGLDLEPAAGLLTRLNSVEKSIVYWFRLSSLDVGRRFRQSLFCIEPGSGDVAPAPWLCHLVEATQILGLASVLVSVIATWWFVRRARAASSPTPRAIADWYRQYVVATLIAVVVSALVSPVLPQGWHVLIALPAACLPVAAWIAHRWPTAGSSLRAVIVLYVLWRIPASLLLLGHPMYARPSSSELPRHIAPVELRILLPDR